MAERSLKFGLSARLHDDFDRVFAQYPEIRRVLIFGSRAKGTFRDGSDIDLAVFAPEMNGSRFARLWSDIDDLPIVFKVDLLHWDRLANDRLKQKIPAEGQIFYPKDPAPPHEVRQHRRRQPQGVQGAAAGNAAASSTSGTSPLVPRLS
jgi:uncharacterized protein